MPYKIQHLGLGGILDQAIALTKNHFGVLFGITLCLFIPLQIVIGFADLATTPELPEDASFEEVMEAYEEQQTSPLVGVLQIVGALIIFPLTNAAIIHAVSKLYLGRDTSVGEALKRGSAVLLPLIGTTILVYLAIAGGLILLIIPGILFALWFGLSQHVVVIEGISGTSALGRSKQLVRGYLGTLLALGILVTLITFLLQIGAFFIPQPHLAIVVASLLMGVTTVFGTAAWVVFYFSCRCAVENFDLQYLAESIGESAPADQEAGGPSYHD